MASGSLFSNSLNKILQLFRLLLCLAPSSFKLWPSCQLSPLLLLGHRRRLVQPAHPSCCRANSLKQTQSRAIAGSLKFSAELWGMRADSYVRGGIGMQFGTCAGRLKYVLCVLLHHRPGSTVKDGGLWEQGRE